MVSYLVRARLTRFERRIDVHAVSFLHHLCTFALVAAVAIEFTLIRLDLTLSWPRGLQVSDLDLPA